LPSADPGTEDGVRFGGTRQDAGFFQPVGERGAGGEMRSRHLKEAQRWRDRADQMRSLASETDDPESRSIISAGDQLWLPMQAGRRAGRLRAASTYELTAIRTDWERGSWATNETGAQDGDAVLSACATRQRFKSGSRFCQEVW